MKVSNETTTVLSLFLLNALLEDLALPSRIQTNYVKRNKERETEDFKRREKAVMINGQ